MLKAALPSTKRATNVPRDLLAEGRNFLRCQNVEYPVLQGE